MSNIADTTRQDEGKSHSHVDVDNKDQRSLANRVEAEKKHDKEEEERENEEKPLPTAAAIAHGNEPSKGAKIDEQLELEEEAEIAKKDAAKAQSAAAKK